MAYVSTYQAFPFCQVSARSDLPVGTMTGPDLTGVTPYPIETSLDEMFKYCWRVKTWEWNLNIACTTVVEDFDHPGETITGVFSVNSTGSWDTYGGVAQGEETKIVCGPEFGIGGADPETFPAACHVSYSFDPGLDTDVDVDLNMSIVLPFYTGGASVARWKNSSVDDQVFFPIFGGMGILISAVLTGIQSAGFQGASNLGTGSPGYVGTSFPTLDGKLFPVFNYELANQISTTPTITGTIAPVEWYKYDPGDGPVWNSSTGAQLRDPFSIQR